MNLDLLEVEDDTSSTVAKRECVDISEGEDSESDNLGMPGLGSLL